MDLIDRDKAIEEVMILRDTLEENVIAYMVLSGAYDTLMGIPSVREWIPCSERLPEKGTYLVTSLYDGGRYVEVGHYIEWAGKMEWHDDSYEANPLNVIAWMELPEPFNGEVEE